jgi:hypothetical protein
MSPRFFGTRFAQTVPPAQVDAAYDRYIVPTPRKIYWDGLVSATGKIRWANPDRAPLLLIGGGIDLIAQAKMTKAMLDWACEERPHPQCTAAEGRLTALKDRQVFLLIGRQGRCRAQLLEAHAALCCTKSPYAIQSDQ